MKVAILGPGGVGGLIAGALARAGKETLVIAQPATAAVIAERGVRVSSVALGEFVAFPRALERLEEPVDALIVATKAAGLAAALERVAVEPGIVLPLLNGLDHLDVLRRRFSPRSVLAGAIRVEADRPEAGVVVHTSPFLRVDMAVGPALPPGASAAPRSASAEKPSASSEGGSPDAAASAVRLAATLTDAGIPARVLDSEAQVMWAKLVRLNALACVTSAHDKLLGEIRSTPALRAELLGAIEEGAAVARAEGADIGAAGALDELERAHDSLGSSMQRDIAAGRPPELDAIPGSVLRAAARHGLPCPTISGLRARIEARIAALAAGRSG
jgi:2-dehydropantoate 2-reductase